MDVLVVALLRVPAPDRRADGLDDDDLATLLSAHALGTPRDDSGDSGVTYCTGPQTDQSTEEDRVQERLAIAGSGAIACGLAATAAAPRLRAALRPLGGRGRPRAGRPSTPSAGASAARSTPRNVRVVTDLGALAGATLPRRGGRRGRSRPRSVVLAGLARAPPATRSWPRRRRRSRSPTLAAAAGDPGALRRRCTSSTPCRG